MKKLLPIQNALLAFTKKVWSLSKMGCCAGADPRFFLGGGALVSFSTSTLINHIVFFFFAEYQLYWKTAGHLGEGGHTPCTLSLDPPLLHKILTWATVLYIHGQVSVEMHKIPVKKIVNYLTSTWLTLSLVGCVLWVFYLMVPHYDGSTLKYFVY